MSHQDIEFAAGASAGSAAIATANIPVVGSAIASVAAHGAAVSGMAHLGLGLAAFCAPVAPFLAIGAGIYAIARLIEEESH